MKKPETVSVDRFTKHYLARRLTELATPATRATTEPLAEWATRRIRLDGRPFSFEGHEYLRAIYDETAPHTVVSKAAQVGGSTWALLRSIHACSKGLNVGYYFPTKTDVLEFSKSRVGPLIAENRFLQRLVRDTDTAGLKRIAEAHLYLRGMQSTVGMKSIPLDLLVFDELDEAPPESKAMARERLAHSDYKRIIELSNPSLPNYGIDEAYQRSDQRHWTIRCTGCSRWTSPDQEFPVSLGQDVPILREREDGSCYHACPACGDPLDLAAGEWVATFPDRSVRGYRISQLLSSKVDPAEILHEYRTTRFPERFYNLKIGIAWADTQNRLDPGSVLACVGEHGLLDGSTEACTMGVDTGKELHVVISRYLREGDGLRQVVYIGTRQSYGELDELMRRYRVRRCVIDALPEIHATRDFAGRHPGRVYMNYFQESQRGSYRWQQDERIVTENRIEALDASRQLIRERRVLLPRAGKLLEEFAAHMAADVKQLVEDEQTGEKSYRYVRTGTNHYSLAFTYDAIAWSGQRYGSGGCRVGVVPADWFEQMTNLRF